MTVVRIAVNIISVLHGKKMITEAELLADISEQMQNNDVLCPIVFDGHGQMYDYVRQNLLKIADFFIEQSQKALSPLKIEDIVLCGGICSYIYNAKTDVDIGVVARPETENYDAGVVQRLFDTINEAFPSKGYRFNLFKRNIDYGLVEPSYFFSGSRVYSLKDDSWRAMPVHRVFSYTPEEFMGIYKKYCDDLYLWADGLEKIDGQYLTFESCKKLEQRLAELKEDALKQKENGPEQEYGLAYNLYRFFNKFGVKANFLDMIKESHYQLVNVLEIEDA